MRISAAALAVLAIVLTGSVPLALQPGQDAGTPGAIRGAVTDGSAGVLPGVTVVATGADGRVVATTVTDGAGVYVLTGLPAGSVTLGSRARGVCGGVSGRGRAAWPGGTRRAAPASGAAVGDRGRARAGRCRTAAPALRSAAATAAARGAAAAGTRSRGCLRSREARCGNRSRSARIKSRRHARPGELYLEGAELVIDGGLDDGLLVGRNLVVRRHYHVHADNGTDILAEHSAGVVQIVAATAHESVGLVVYACDAMQNGRFPRVVQARTAPGSRSDRRAGVLRRGAHPVRGRGPVAGRAAADDGDRSRRHPRRARGPALHAVPPARRRRTDARRPARRSSYRCATIRPRSASNA